MVMSENLRVFHFLMIGMFVDAGPVAQSVWWPRVPILLTDLSNDFSDGDAEHSVAVQHSHSYLGLCDLAVEFLGD